MKYIPIKLKPDFKARGWVPETGWYLYNTQTLRADLSEKFESKKACQKVCDKKNQKDLTNQTR